MRLIVANQTLGGAKLDQAVRERISQGHRDFYILVPIDAHYETQTWVVPDAGIAIPPPDPDEIAESLAAAERRSADRLEQMLGKISAAGGTATGEIGPPDPVEAVHGLLERRQFDEVIVSTLPAGISRWLKLDLPSRVRRLTDIPVTVIEKEA